MRAVEGARPVWVGGISSFSFDHEFFDTSLPQEAGDRSESHTSRDTDLNTIIQPTRISVVID